MIAVEDTVEKAVEEAFVADGDVCAAVDVSIGAVDVYVSFVIVCVVEVAGFAVVVFVQYCLYSIINCIIQALIWVLIYMYRKIRLPPRMQCVVIGAHLISVV